MAAKFTQAFTDGLSRIVGEYTTDAATVFNISVREGYAGAAVSGITANGGTPSIPVRFRARCLHLKSTTAPNGAILQRKVPCNLTQIVLFFGALQAGTGGNIQITGLDGLNWEVTGYTGEYLHKTRG